MKREIPGKDLISSGHLACQGCGAVLAMRYVLKALGEKTVVVIPACCWSIIPGPFPYSALKIAAIHVAFETAASSAAGVRAGFDVQGKEDVNVLAFAGDGGTFDIGLQSLSGAVERNENIIYVCYDNEAYMNTGIQRSSATPEFAWTTTTPLNKPKEGAKKDIVKILAGHSIPYAATATVAYPEDLIRKVAKAGKIKGSRFIHILAPCPPGWKSDPMETIKIARLAVQSKVFPLYEVEHGEKYIINTEPTGVSVQEYLKTQGRFSHLNPQQIEEIQARVDYHWERLLYQSMLDSFKEWRK